MAKLRVLMLPFLSQASFFIAEEEGLFAEQRLQIEYIRMSDSAMAIPALARGDLDVIGSILRISQFNAISREGKIKFVAGKGYLDPTGCSTYSTFIARRSLIETGELKNPAQLKGKRVEISPGSLEAYYLDKLLNTAGLTLADVKTTDIPTPLINEAFEKGMVDLTVTAQPRGIQILKSGHGVLWKSVHQLLPEFQFGNILYGPSLLHHNPEVGKRFMVAHLKAVRQYNEGKTKRNLEILAKHTQLDHKLLEEVCWPAMRTNGQIHIDSLMDYQAWALKKGLLDKMVSPNQFWDPSYIEYANKVLNKLTK
jgi:NitT/TauT family transport system substrate-binding protein